MGYLNNTNFVSGEWDAICDVCGVKYKASELRERWDKLMVCKSDFETRHPQDLMKAPAPERAVPWTRPEGVDTFVEVTYNTTIGVQDNTIPSGTFTQGT